MSIWEQLWNRHPLVISFLSAVFILMTIAGVILFFDSASVGFRQYHFVYVGQDGAEHEAEYCSIPYRSQARCTLQDGTTVLDMKSYRKVVDE